MKDKKIEKFLREERTDGEAARLMMKKLMKSEERVICTQFIAAVNNFDGQKIIEIANAVWLFKGIFKGGQFPDQERAELILLKEILNRCGEKLKIRQVAEYLARGKKIETPADGFKALRDKCRALDFPLDEKRKIRRR